MNRKLLTIVVSMLVLTSGIVLISTHKNVTADEDDTDSGVELNLPYTYCWEQVINFSRVIYRADYSGDNNIPRGREWATAGEQYTIDNILEKQMNGINKPCGLTGYKELELQYINNFPWDIWEYSSKLVLNTFNLTINYDSYPFSSRVPKTEIFAMPAGVGDWRDGVATLTTTYDFTDQLVENHDINELWPLGGLLTNCFKNLSCSSLNNAAYIVGNVTYLQDNESVPTDQEGRVFLFNDTEWSQKTIDNITGASGCILIASEGDAMFHTNYSKCTYTVMQTSIGSDNLSQIIDMLQNGTQMLADNYVDRNITTFTYNLSCPDDWPSQDFVAMYRIPTPFETLGLLHKRWDAANFSGKLLVFTSVFLNGYDRYIKQKDHHDELGYCTGIIMYDMYDTHFMIPSTRNWLHPNIADIVVHWPDSPGLPIFSVNHSVGEHIRNNVSNGLTVDIYLDQTFEQQTPFHHVGVPSYDVVAYRDGQDNTKTMIINSRPDNWWNQGSGDSGVGCSVVLALAKYFHDNDITPKYNLTFLFTTGEEYGNRGGYYYRHQLPDDDIVKVFFAFDQIALKQKNTTFGITFRNETLKKIFMAIANDTNYAQRTDQSVKYNVPSRYTEGGSEEDVWADKTTCNAFVFGDDSDRNWTGYHRAGQNYTKGDVLNSTDIDQGINRSDMNITLELAWNFTKYFGVNPNCWFSSTAYESVDSQSGDTMDSIQATFKVKSTLPSDLVMVNATLLDSSSQPVTWELLNFTTDRTGVEKTLTVTMPSGVKEGDYSFSLKVYNSTGRINKIVGINNIANDTDASSSFRLHRYHAFGSNEVGGSFRSVEDRINGSVFTPSESGVARNITAYVKTFSTAPAPEYKCMIYQGNELVGTTNSWGGSKDEDSVTSQWITFEFPDSTAYLEKDKNYIITCWGNNSHSQLYYTGVTVSMGRYNFSIYGTPPNPIQWADTVLFRKYSLFCCYTPDPYPPSITNIVSTPVNTSYFSSSYTFHTNISCTVTDNVSGVDLVKVAIRYPNGTLWMNQTMSKQGASTYWYNVSGQNKPLGKYNYTIWAKDNVNNSITSSTHYFTVSLCGDANSDGYVTVGDMVYLQNYLYKSGPAPSPLCRGDANDDDIVDAGDIVYLRNYLYSGGPPPVDDCCPL